MNIYHLLLILVILEILTTMIPRITGLFTALRTLAGLAGALFILAEAGRPPLYGPFESAVFLSLITGGLALCFSRRLDKKAGYFRVEALFILVILALQWGSPMNLNPDYYMYENLWVTLFFFLRLLAVGFLVHGAAQYLAGIQDAKARQVFMTGGRNTLLAGACIYLSSEWAGSLWCLNWLGDSWQWSRGFFKASLLFLLVMGACHLPGSMARRPGIRGLAGALPGIFGIYMVFYH